MCTADEERFATPVQVMASTDKRGLKGVDTNRHFATEPITITNSYIHKLPTGFRIQGRDPGQRDPLV